MSPASANWLARPLSPSRYQRASSARLPLVRHGAKRHSMPVPRSGSAASALAGAGSPVGGSGSAPGR
jgi:hypothetical protein